jgi:hypothetical protein
VMMSSNCWRSWSGCSIMTTGREPRRRQVETVERGILMCLGRHLVPVLTTWFRIRWSYAHRVRDVAAWVSGIAKASPLMAHLANKYFNDISHADVANTKCERSAHTAALPQHASVPSERTAHPTPLVVEPTEIAVATPRPLKPETCGGRPAHQTSRGPQQCPAGAACGEPGDDLQPVQRSASQPSHGAKSSMISAMPILRTQSAKCLRAQLAYLQGGAPAKLGLSSPGYRENGA